MKKLFIVLSFFTLMSPTWAISEILTGGSAGAVNFSGEGRKDTTLALGLGYHHIFSPYFQFGVVTESGYIHFSGSGNAWYAFVAPSLMFSLPWGEKNDARSALYFQLAPGVIFADTTVYPNELKYSVSDTSFMGKVEIGNRFSVAENISYTPSIGAHIYEATNTDGVTVDPYFTFLQFDLFF